MELEKVANKSQIMIGIIASLIVTAVCVTAYAFTNFQTKVSADFYYQLLEKKIDKIDEKIDKILVK